METELAEIKEKILNFCRKYKIKDVKIEATDIITEVTGSTVVNISTKIEV